MEIKLTESGNKGIVYINEGKGNLAEMTWVKGGDDYIIVDHTMVDDSLKGQGIGRKLLDRIVELARERNLKILPLCPFVKATFNKVQEIRDVLYQ
ncbi:MAG: GNAT family N-acetyltransferase [Lentimicrobium sp.]